MAANPKISQALSFWLAGAFLLLLYLIKTPLIMALISLGIGVVLSPLLNKIEEKVSWPRALLAALVYLALLGLVMALVYFLERMAADQISSLVSQFPDMFDNIRKNIRMYAGQEEINRFLNNLELQKTLKRIGGGAVSVMGATATWLSWGVFILVVSFYFTIHIGYYRKLVIEVLPEERRKAADKAVTVAGRTLRQWFGAQLTDMGLVALLTATGLYIVGFEYWLVIGAMTFFLTLIPFIGIFTVVAVSFLVGLANDPSQLPWLALVFLITQQLESNLILPYLMRERVLLPEVILLVFMVFMGAWLGLLGILIAAPLLAVLFSFFKEFTSAELEKPPSFVKKGQS